MGELSRQSSRRPLVLDDTASFTSFPDPSEASLPVEEPSNVPLHGLLDRAGPSMFDENNAIDANDPQSLSAAPNPVLQNLIDHHGAVELVKRLSTMLAERDAHITALTRLAEEYKVPRQRISETASRAKQAERRRLSLATASEDLGPPSVAESVTSDSGESRISKSTQNTAAAPAKGITKLFGGGTIKKAKAKPAPVPLPISNATSREPSRPRRHSERPKSIDTQSIRSIDSGNTWTASINNIFGASHPKRTDSLRNRLPVEMETRHDPDQLPPTLSNHADDPQEAEWNKFILKLVELRPQNGEDPNGGELIGASRFGQEGSAGRQKMETLTRLVIGGIPMKLRHPLWMELSNTQAMMQPEDYEHYLNLGENDDEEEEMEAILKDVPRTLTTKYDFYSGKGFQRLKDLLVAFVAKYPNLGYTQGLNTIAGYLLLAIPSEEDAFWVLCNIVENFFPPDYFSRTDAMISPLADNALLRQYVKEHLPLLHNHMDKLGILPGHTVPMKWFFTAFSSALPETLLMRLWDIWLCIPSQKQYLFAFALALIAQNADGILECEDSSSFFSYMDSKLKLPEDAAGVTELMKQAWKIAKKLGDGVAGRRASEVVSTKEGMGLEMRLQRRRTGSLEVLVDREEEEGEGMQTSS
ncbi:uncharacterized protein LTR77_009318 [Saxophila tyrrhenica]|uniref:Rab-GAP TBC domain-containing protein n=1 Tax=Saxophila tyrrhenica TaxID=1690608 RepID=A0AAV9NZC2_9PEZI|nr:hypothetical protein LTR77_009318 [Saxophila tyrrhenica]